MNHWADRFLVLLCSFALIAVLIVPYEEHGKPPVSILSAALKR
ncbi:MAG TPA: hypothetical protein VMT94_02235 [Burkholderiales bacterium]|nr:hypothetical protein [Burkholderiales bacterium]